MRGSSHVFLAGNYHSSTMKTFETVSGTLCPLISFLDVSFLISFVVRGQRPRRRTETKKTEKIPLCGDFIGHLPLRSRCPKVYKKNV